MIDKCELAYTLKELRILRRMSIETLAYAVGLTPNAMDCIETAEVDVSTMDISAFAKALRVPEPCLMILGSTEIRGQKEATELMKSVKKLIWSTIKAQSKVEHGHN